MLSGIYKITNNITNQNYIGKATNIKGRINKHKMLLRKNKHWNKHLQSSWNKYGELNFKFEIVEYCNKDVLNEKEKHYIIKFDSRNNGFNQTDGGDGLMNYKHTDEAKRKIGESSRQRKLSPEHREKLLAAVTGRKKSKEELEKLSKAAKGRKISEWHKQQLINSIKGKPISEWHKKRISEAQKGRPVSEKQKADISKSLQGNKNAQKLSPEMKEVIKKMFLDDNKIKVDDIAKQYNVSPSTIYGLRREALRSNK